MQIKLHLISMPWANPELPSIQTAVLKAYIDSVLGDRVVTRTYSAFASILLEQHHKGYADYYDKYQSFEEYPYFLMYYRRFLRHDQRLKRVSADKLIERINDRDSDEPLTLRKVAHLQSRTHRYIEETIVPQLSRRSLNVVGFTLNYYQLYASLYCARYLQESFPDYKYLFVFGGATVIYPKVAEVLKVLGVEGLCVIGEGERKLELILKEILATPSGNCPDLIERLAALHEGIYDIQHRTVNLYEPTPATLLDLQMSMDNLPQPIFSEYYASLRKVFTDRKLYAKYKADTWLALEGTRGCFAHCDFCDVHTSWSGFRKSTPERILANVLELASKHRSPRIKFMDNVCDTWAERYAELLIERKIRIASFMECRVHHPETFWTKLSLSGVELVQVGIEALSPTLIRAMNKGTRAKQNLLVQKWLKELGIASLSNLITHHPKSTLQHVEETKHVLRLIPHLDRLDFSPLALLIGSPLDGRLSAEEKRQLEERQLFALPRRLDKYFVLKGEYDPPDNWFEGGVFNAWDKLIEWEEQLFRTCGEDAFMSSTRYGSEEILIRDGRYGEIKEYYLVGDTARVYNLCHQGATPETLSRDTELPATTIAKVLSWLIGKQLLVELDGFYIALALRPRDELIHNYVESAVPRSSLPPQVKGFALPLYQGTQVSGAS
jgi:radical SAM superfamily enzyme YgiQ (UPF0313 family)